MVAQLRAEIVRLPVLLEPDRSPLRDRSASRGVGDAAAHRQTEQDHEHGETEGVPAAKRPLDPLARDPCLLGLRRKAEPQRPPRHPAIRKASRCRADGVEDAHLPAARARMRMRGLEPPPDFSDTDLNRARLPIPPHPRAAEQAKISHRPTDGPDALLASAPVERSPLSSRGLGRRPLMAETRVRIPVAVCIPVEVYPLSR